MTYFEGDSKNGLAPDSEARDFWLQQGVPDDHILTGDAKDNFWGEPTRAFGFEHDSDHNLRNGRNRSMRTLQVRVATLGSNGT